MALVIKKYHSSNTVTKNESDTVGNSGVYAWKACARVFTYGHFSTNIQPHLGRHPVQITAIFSADTEIMSLAEHSLAQVQTENGTGSYWFRGG